MSAFGPRYGGPDGTRHIFKILAGIDGFIEPGEGRLWLLVISLADTGKILKRLGELFEQVTIVKETERVFLPGEYDSLQGGLFQYLMTLRDEGRADFVEKSYGTYAFKNLFIRAEGLK